MSPALSILYKSLRDPYLSLAADGPDIPVALPRKGNMKLIVEVNSRLVLAQPGSRGQQTAWQGVWGVTNNCSGQQPGVR